MVIFFLWTLGVVLKQTCSYANCALKLTIQLPLLTFVHPCLYSAEDPSLKQQQQLQ